MAISEARAARQAGLRYVSDAGPGISRVRAGTAFRYVAAGRGAVRDRATLARIRALAVPPAWHSVWICPREDGHLQATGRDARGRKQYRYHARWREVRDETKYGRVAAFGRALPRIRRRVRADLARAGLPREKVLATVVRLLESTFMRVGNQEYARENDSFGLTTLRERQVRVRGSRLRFEFRGKSGVEHRIEVSDPLLARIVRRMQDQTGEELFRYLDDEGATRTIESADVNAYLRDAAGEDFTSKDFRTWAGTLLAVRSLRALPRFDSAAQTKKNVVQAVDAVSRQLGNTKAVCRKCYIHPAVFDAYLDGSLARVAGMSERAVLLALLRSNRARRRDRASLVPALARSLAHRRDPGHARIGAASS